MAADEVLLYEDLVPVLERARTRQSFPAIFFLKWSFECSAAFKRDFRPTWCDTWKLKDSQTGSHLGRDDPQRCNGIKIMPFIQTRLAQSESARPKATTMYVCMLSRSFLLPVC